MYRYNIYKFIYKTYVYMYKTFFDKIIYFYKITAIRVFSIGFYDLMRPFS